MTKNEQTIIEFLFSNDVVELADLPDWLLGLMGCEWGEEEQPPPKFITGALCLLVRREYPGVTLGKAQRLMADSLTNPAKVEELTERLTCFRLACSLERLRRAGRYEEVFGGDPFDPNAEVAVKLTNEDFEFFNSQPSKEEVGVTGACSKTVGQALSQGLDLSALVRGRLLSAAETQPLRRGENAEAHGLSAVPHATLEAFAAQNRRTLQGASRVSRLSTAS
ncbi:MAG TPA: hypothetical protein VKP69_06460 [Isosphaeraceae bacterium]|nr:hypothetical protein [Isosphaeraceae bacterium]